MKPSLVKVKNLLESGWATNYQVATCTGISGMRRLRELRAMGFPILKRQIIRNGKASGTYEYKIPTDEKQMSMFDRR